MRLPLFLLDSQFFLFSSVEELVAALGDSVAVVDKEEVVRLAELGLPPVCTREVLATMLGINPGLLWSFEYRPDKHYRIFRIPKGARGEREIVAPRVALKILQKWLSVLMQRHYAAPDHVFGFVSGRSHLEAAKVHRMAHWTFSVDIANFFPSTPAHVVAEAFESIGFGAESAEMLARLTCYRGFLAQGAPTSPVMSNIALRAVDEKLSDISRRFGARLSRYADDIVFSGVEDFPEGLRAEVADLMTDTPWELSTEKTEFNQLPNRLKVHGVLVHGPQIRLTKGYRNKLRAYAHLSKRGRIRQDDRLRVAGHIRYGMQVEEVAD